MAWAAAAAALGQAASSGPGGAGGPTRGGDVGDVTFGSYTGNLTNADKQQGIMPSGGGNGWLLPAALIISAILVAKGMK